MERPDLSDVQQAIDGVCAKGVAGACLTYWLGNINTIVAICVGLATLVYVGMKIARLRADKGQKE